MSLSVCLSLFLSQSSSLSLSLAVLFSLSLSPVWSSNERLSFTHGSSNLCWHTKVGWKQTAGTRSHNHLCKECQQNLSPIHSQLLKGQVLSSALYNPQSQHGSLRHHCRCCYMLRVSYAYAWCNYRCYYRLWASHAYVWCKYRQKSMWHLFYLALSLLKKERKRSPWVEEGRETRDHFQILHWLLFLMVNELCF